MFWEGNVRHIFLNLSFYPNVRGQGTRHLVTGTLDPLVGAFVFHSNRPLASHITVVMGMVIMNTTGNDQRMRNRSSVVGCAGRLVIIIKTPIQYAAIAIAHN